MAEWVGKERRPLELAAAKKDALALLESYPLPPMALATRGDGEAEGLMALGHRLFLLLKDHFVRLLQDKVRRTSNIVSPYAGGVPVSHHPSFHQPRSHHAVSHQPGSSQLSAQRAVSHHPSSHHLLSHQLASQPLTLAVLNPGRSGFLSISGDALLNWRLHALSAALEDARVDICVCPGPRLPEGAALPAGFGFSFFGERTATWSSVGVFVRTEIAHAVQPLHDFSVDRALWFEVQSTIAPDAGPLLPSIFCACYPAPGGDEETWRNICETAEFFTAKHPGANITICGDTNVHLSYVVSHQQGCKCSHCHQTSADRRIENKLTALGFLAANPQQTPTHESGTVIDLVLCRRGHRPPVSVQAVPAMQSDHKMLTWQVDVRCERVFSSAVGRVSWRTDAQWDAVLGRISALLFATAAATEGLLTATWLRPPWFGGTASVAERRGLLDLAAWTREAIYTMAGHAAGVTRAVSTATPPNSAPLDPASYADHRAFKAAVAQATWTAKQRAVGRYAALRRTDVGRAEAFCHVFSVTLRISKLRSPARQRASC